MDPQLEEVFAESAVISGADPTDSSVTALLADSPTLFVAAQRNAVYA